MAFSLGVVRRFMIVVSVLSTQSEGTEGNSYANTSLLNRLAAHFASYAAGVGGQITIFSQVVSIQFSCSEIVSSANTVLHAFVTCTIQTSYGSISGSIFVTEILNSSAHSQGTTSVADAQAISFCTLIFLLSNGSYFLIVVTNRCFNTNTTELARVVNTIDTVSVEGVSTKTMNSVTSSYVNSLVIAGDRVHWSPVTTQQHLTEAAFQTNHGTTVKTTIPITVTGIETSFQRKYSRQAIAQILLTFKAKARAGQVALTRVHTSCTIFSSGTASFSFNLINTKTSINDTVQRNGRLCGSSAHSSQSGNSNQRFFHCKFLQG